MGVKRGEKQDRQPQIRRSQEGEHVAAAFPQDPQGTEEDTSVRKITEDLVKGYLKKT